MSSNSASSVAKMANREVEPREIRNRDERTLNVYTAHAAHAPHVPLTLGAPLPPTDFELGEPERQVFALRFQEALEKHSAVLWKEYLATLSHLPTPPGGPAAVSVLAAAPVAGPSHQPASPNSSSSNLSPGGDRLRSWEREEKERLAFHVRSEEGRVRYVERLRAEFPAFLDSVVSRAPEA